MFPIQPLLGLVVLALLQQEPQQGGQQGEPTPPAQPGGPEIKIRDAAGMKTPTDVPAKRIPDIKAYRGGAETSAWTRRLEDARLVDLSHVDFDAPVVARIDGKDITRDDVMNWVAFTAGISAVQTRQLEILTGKIVDAIRLAGGDTKSFEVTDEEVTGRLRTMEDDARGQGEETFARFVDEVERVIGVENFRTMIRIELRCEKLLLPQVDPEKPDEGVALPPESAELLSKQETLRNYLAETYMSGNPIPPMFRLHFLKMLQAELIDRAEIKFAIDEDLGPGVFMTVDGVPVTRDDVLALVKVTPSDKERALRLLLSYRAVDAALAKAGYAFGDDEFALAFAAHEAEYEGTLFPLKNMISLRGFFSMQEYMQFFRRRAAFQKMVQETEVATLEEEYRKHHEQFGRLFYESGKVTAEVIFTSMELSRRSIGPDATDEQGWQKAEERILGALEAVTNGGKSFAEARKEFGDPLANAPTGVLHQKLRTELRSSLGETEYSVFADGYSLGDDIFYNRTEGEIVGPYRHGSMTFMKDRGALGYLLVKVIEYRYAQPLKDFNIQKPLVITDYVDLRFINFAQRCLDEAKIELTETT